MIFSLGQPLTKKNGKDLIITPYNKNVRFEPWEIGLKAPLKPETEFSNKLLSAAK